MDPEPRYRVGRRRFLQSSLACGGLSLWSCSSPGPAALPTPTPLPASVPRIAYLRDSVSETAVPEPFLRGLAELGYTNGETISIDVRLSGWGFSETMRSAIEAALKNDPRLLVVDGNPFLRYAREMAPNLPIVMLYGGDPVEEQVVTSLDRPAGNVTGVASIPEVHWTRRLSLLKALAPAISRVAVIWQPGLSGSPGSKADLAGLQRAAASLGLDVAPIQFNSAGGTKEADLVVEKIEAARPNALVMMNHSRVVGSEARFAELGIRNGWPSIVNREWSVERAGVGVMSASVTWAEVQYLSAGYVDRILKGASPGQLPLRHPREYRFSLNATTAATLGLAIPAEVLAQATAVYT